MVTALPSNGTILLAGGVKPTTLGETLTVQQLTALKFRPTLNLYGQNSSFALIEVGLNSAKSCC